MSEASVPPLSVRRNPGLSVTLPYAPNPTRCQSCGEHAAGDLVRWIEGDPWDQPTDVIVVLCRPCGDRLIEPHWRLYRKLERNEPRTGCMGICVRCTWRRGTRCSHPDAKPNGGPGLEIGIARPTRMHVYCSGRGGARRSGWVTDWPEPARSCAGRRVPEPPAPSNAPDAAPPALAPATGPIEAPAGS